MVNSRSSYPAARRGWKCLTPPSRRDRLHKTENLRQHSRLSVRGALMADDLGFEFFKAGKDHLESATKWQLIVAAILIYLHFGIVAPFGVKSLEKDGLDADVTARKGEQMAIAPATQKARE